MKNQWAWKKHSPMEARICSFPEPRGRPLPRFTSPPPNGWMANPGGGADAGDSWFPPTSYFRGLPLPLFTTTCPEPAASDLAPVSEPASTPTASVAALLLSLLAFTTTASSSLVVVFGSFWVTEVLFWFWFWFWSSMNDTPFEILRLSTQQRYKLCLWVKKKKKGGMVVWQGWWWVFEVWTQYCRRHQKKTRLLLSFSRKETVCENFGFSEFFFRNGENKLFTSWSKKKTLHFFFLLFCYVFFFICTYM